MLGAVAFAGLAAVVLPMVMDQEPKQQVQDIQIRIPGQDQTTFAPRLDRPAKTPVPDTSDSKLTEKDTVKKDTIKEEAGKISERPGEEPPENVAQMVEKAAAQKAAKPLEKAAGQKADKQEKPTQSTKTTEKKSEKSAERAVDRSAEKTTGKGEEKNQDTVSDSVAKRTRAEEAQRAAAALAGEDVDGPVKEKSGAEKNRTAKSGQYVILIGAFSNAANVKQLQGKLGEQGIRVFTESIESGKKTRVRAGPFASREAAEKAAEKMKQIGVNGVIAGKP